MNLSPEECSQWRKNKGVNPLTGRKIQEGKGVYKELEKACKEKPSPKKKSPSPLKKKLSTPNKKKTPSPKKVGKKNSLKKAPCQEQPNKYKWIVGKGCHEKSPSHKKQSPKKESHKKLSLEKIDITKKESPKKESPKKPSSEKIDITKKQCLELIFNPYIDPITNKELKLKDNRYLSLVKQCNIPVSLDTITPQHCELFLNDPDTNSISNNPITIEELDIFYQKCGFMSGKTKGDVIFEKQLPSSSCDVLKYDNDLQIKSSISLSQLAPNCVTYNRDFNYWKNVRLWIVSQYIYISRLSSEDKNILFNYKGSDYTLYNNTMRKEKSICDHKNPNLLVDNLKNLYRIIINAPKTPPNLLVFRGERINIKNNYILKSHYINNGFISTSFNFNIAKSFSHKHNAAILQINVPKSIPAIFFPGTETEVLLPPCDLEFKGIIYNWNEEINTSLPSSLNKHPASYVFEYNDPLPLEYGTPIDKPDLDTIVKNFCSYFKKYIFDYSDIYTWVIKGGYGLNTLLENKFNYHNLIPTYDLDLAIYYNIDKVTENQISVYIKDLKIEIDKFINLIKNKYKLTNKEFYYIESKRQNMTILFIMYKYCKNENSIIDISIIGKEGGFNNEYIDKEISKKTGLPIKTTIGYYLELKDLLFRENIKDLDPDTYKTRNLNISIKGKKTIQRIQELCKIDKSGRSIEDYNKMCTLLEQLDINTLKSNKDHLEKMLNDWKLNKNTEISLYNVY